jgi:hypothetical protein
MTRLIDHIRGNLIGYLALFCALGGTSYAAISIPRNSIGTPQLRNGAITRAKLSSRSIAGSVVFWARIDQAGQVVSSSERATASGWASGHGTIVFRGQISSKCFALANVTTTPITLGYVTTTSTASVGGREQLSLFMETAGTNQPGPLPIVVAEICP